MKNWFNSLNESLASENLVDQWPLGRNISYGENVRIHTDTMLISVYRETNGMYERPVHYSLT